MKEMLHRSLEPHLPTNPEQRLQPRAPPKAFDEHSSHSVDSSTGKVSTSQQTQFRAACLPNISRPPNHFYRIHQRREQSYEHPPLQPPLGSPSSSKATKGAAVSTFLPRPPPRGPLHQHSESTNALQSSVVSAYLWTNSNKGGGEETGSASADPIPQLVTSPPVLPLIPASSSSHPHPSPAPLTSSSTARSVKESSNALSLPLLVVQSSSATVTPSDRPLRPSRPPQSNPGIGLTGVTPPSSSVTPLAPPLVQQRLDKAGLPSSRGLSPGGGGEGVLSSAAVTPSARRASSIHSASARDAAKKAAQRILKLMFRINVTTSSPLIVLLKQIPPDVLSRVLHQKARSFKRRLNKSEFLDFMNAVVDEAIRQASPMSGAVESSPMQVPTQRRKSSLASATETTAASVLAANESSSRLVAHGGRHPRASSFHREDTDVIFHLFDEGETGNVGTKHVCDSFFTIALATKADIVARLVTMVFASPSYHNLESTISRFEVQLMTQLLCEVFQESEAGFQAAVQRMAEHDRNALVAFEAMNPRTSFPAEDDSEASRAVQRRHEWLRGMANQTLAERENRLRLLLSAVSRFPDVLCDRPTGSLLVRELRDVCARETFLVYGEEVTLAHGWRKQRKSVLHSQMRYDEAFLQLVQYVGQGSSQPSTSKLAMRASHVAMAASSMLLQSSARKLGLPSSSSSLTSTRNERSGGAVDKDNDDENDELDDNDEDPMLAEALRFQQLKSQQVQYALETQAAKRSFAAVGRERFLGRFRPGGSGGGAVTPRATAENPSQADLFRKPLHRHPSVLPSLGGLSDGADGQQRMSPKSSFSDIRRVESTSGPLLGEEKVAVGTKTAIAGSHSLLRKRTSVVTISRAENENDDTDFPPEHDMPQFETVRGHVYVRTLSCPSARLVNPDGRTR